MPVDALRPPSTVRLHISSRMRIIGEMKVHLVSLPEHDSSSSHFNFALYKY